MFAKCLLVCLIACSSAAPPIPDLQKCKLDDPKCITKSTQAFLPTFTKGNPEWGVEPLDPIFMKNLDASSKDLKLLLTDVTATGLNKCIAKNIEFDKVKSKLFVTAECTVDLEGQYEMDGSIILLKIQGKGHAHVVLRKAVISAEVDIAEVTGKDGLKHWTMKRYTHSYVLKDKATIELENLFNGNEALGRVAKELFASSPNDVVNEVGPPILKAFVDKIVKNAHHFFKKVPLEYLIEQ